MPEADGPSLLEAATLTLRRGPTGAVRLGTPQATHLQVQVYRSFPLSAPEEWIVFFDGAGAHIGTLRTLDGLEAASAALCREELELRYVVPPVTEVLAVREEVLENRWNPALVWDVVTAGGPIRLHLPNLQDHVRVVGDGRLLLTDRDGRRCLLVPAALDAPARALVGRYLWLDGLG